MNLIETRGLTRTVTASGRGAVEIDAYPDEEFKAVVARVAASPRNDQAGADTGGVTFDVVLTRSSSPGQRPRRSARVTN